MQTPSDTTAQIISAISRMVEQDFARQERAKYHEARTRYIQIRMNEEPTSTEAAAEETECGNKPEVANSLRDDELQDSVFYSTSPCHVFRETTV